jgi:rhamnose transport system substrate-binding protein
MTIDNLSMTRRKVLAMGAGVAAVATAGTLVSGPALASKRPVIGMVPKYTSDPYYTAVRKGAEEAAKELDIELLFEGPATQDVSMQNNIVDRMIRQKIDALSLCANDPAALAPAAKRAAERGIPVSTWDSDVNADARAVFLNMSEFKDMGETIVEMIVRASGSEGDFLILTASLSSSNMNNWIEEIKKYAGEKYPKLNIKAVLSGDADLEKSKNVALNYLRGNPDTKGIIAVDGIANVGAAEAVEQLGLQGKVGVAGIGVPSNIRPYIKSGTVSEAVLWDPVDLGYGAIFVSKAQLDGKLDPAAGFIEAGRLGKLKFTSNDVLLLGPPTVFTKENIDNYTF